MPICPERKVAQIVKEGRICAAGQPVKDDPEFGILPGVDVDGDSVARFRSAGRVQPVITLMTAGPPPSHGT
jgi:hypothetical protein